MPKLVVEINAVVGHEPRGSALDLLRTRLQQVVDKPAGIQVLGVRTFASSRSSYTMEDVVRVEKDRRRHYSDPRAGTAVIHVLYLNGRISEAQGAIGVAYRASSIVLLPDQIEAASNPLLSAEKIEQAATVHEMGHLLGLVNIGYRSPRDHEDPEHEGHSKNRRSVMYWAVESLDVANILAGSVPTDFDSDDRADLADRKAGRI